MEPPSSRGRRRPRGGGTERSWAATAGQEHPDWKIPACRPESLHPPGRNCNKLRLPERVYGLTASSRAGLLGGVEVAGAGGQPALSRAPCAATPTSRRANRAATLSVCVSVSQSVCLSLCLSACLSLLSATREKAGAAQPPRQPANVSGIEGVCELMIVRNRPLARPHGVFAVAFAFLRAYVSGIDEVRAGPAQRHRPPPILAGAVLRPFFRDRRFAPAPASTRR